jgi:glycosyltransferase involved in cell wall biosynthesis
MVWKQVDRIISSLRELPEDVELLICGDGPELEPWRELALSLGLEERVHFRGNVPHELVPKHVRAADIFILYSRYEGLSHTLIEVQTLGTPAVASAVCGNPEVISDGESGRLVGVDDAAGLAAALRELLEDEAQRAAFSVAGVAASARFGRSETFTSVEKVLLRAARRREVPQNRAKIPDSRSN